jgi:hypothetical protein
MLEYTEFSAPLLRHPLVPAGPIPTAADPDGCYPYESYVETGERPGLQAHRFVALENDQLRVLICPDLGGRVHSLIDKRTGQETLFVPASIRPARILPRFAFVPGGLEVSFPISHTPVQIEPVHARTERVGERVYVWTGERELRGGLQWTVEFSLGAGDGFLTQRAFFRNPTARPQPWMSWSNAALPARPDTEFHFPNGPVLAHGDCVRTIRWPDEGVRCVRDLDRMTGFFWLEPDAAAFGAFTPSLGHGLYHVADAREVPGMKLWSYGLGRHEAWGSVGSLHGEAYVEIQAGPVKDQSVRSLLAPGETQTHTEFWLPSAELLDIHRLARPQVRPVEPGRVPWFSWAPRAAVGFWLRVHQAHSANSAAQLPDTPPVGDNCWAPSGMDELGPALDWAIQITSGALRDSWRFQKGAWLAGRGDFSRALAVLAESADDRAQALAGRLHLRCFQQPAAAVACFARIASPEVALHPQVVVERDLALAALGTPALAERERWLTRVASSEDDWLRERRVALLADQGRPAEGLALLEGLPFQKVHQRYARTELWRRLRAAAGTGDAAVPESLGEDDLAQFGAYRQFTPSKRLTGNGP